MPRSEPIVLALDKVTVRHVGPLSAIWPGVASPIGPSATVLNQTLYARPLPADPSISSADMVSLAYTTRLGDSGEASPAFPNAVASDGRLYRQRFSPAGRLQWLEISVGGELEQVVCLDTVAVDDGRGFSATQDATDFCASLQGNGAGFNNGTTGQLQAIVFDPPTMGASLFDVQGWQDNSDASFPSLLAALLNSQLGLRLTPWQLLAVDPSGGGGGQVQVHGQDGMFCLKSAYERDWTVVQAPRDVIERSTRLWLPATYDNFPSSSSITAGTLTTPTGTWTVTTGAGGGTVAVGQSGGIVLTAPATTGVFAEITSPAVTVAATGVWSATCAVLSQTLGTTGAGLQLTVTESNGDAYTLTLWLGYATLGGPAASTKVQLASATGYTLQLESDGEWIFGFANGQLVGCFRRRHTNATSIQTQIQLANGVGGPAPAKATVMGALTKAQQPFLQAGSDKGDYVLPGVAATYPNGGLHARYFNNTDLQGDTNRLLKINGPPRTQAYAGSGTFEYQNQQDATINAQANPTPGAANAHWSCIWFGSIYMKLSAGNYTFSIVLPAHANNQAVRAWVGKTQFGTQLVDQWNYSNTSGQTYTFTVTASALAGALAYGGGTVQRDGWYPIKIEYAVDGTNAVAPTFNLTNSPAAYTDPGGTAIASGVQTTVVPATSLSPLGCVDQRYQGLAHFDLCQQTLQAYGYQASVEPKQLESGLFPGVLAPRIREGADYDPILVPDKTAAQDGLLLLRPQQANTWPLPGSIGKLRWRPGDGARVQDRDINVYDTTPRQILAFTRNLLPNGIASALASFANRPITPAKILKQQLYTATRQQRNYQKQLVTLTGSYQSLALIHGAQSTTALNNISIVSLQPGDQIVRAWVRLNSNSGSVSFNLIVNNADQTTTLNGPWTTTPILLDITAVAAPDASSQLYIGLKNNDGVNSSTFNWQLLVDVLR